MCTGGGVLGMGGVCISEVFYILFINFSRG
jgi:hypothetical protein